MRRALALVLGGLLASSVLLGCGQKQTSTLPEAKVTIARESGKTEVTVEGEDGTIELSGDDSRVTITTEEGTAVVEMAPEMTAGEVGLPLYPGAKVEQVMRQSTEEGGEYVEAHLTTSDGFAEVKSFYQKELPQATISGEVDTEAIKAFRAMLDEGGAKKAVMVSRDSSKQKTQIVLDRSVTAE